MIVATLALALALAVPAPLDFKGKWNASSRSHATAHGAMELGDKTIAFEKLGEFHYTLLEERPGVWILQVDRNVECGRFVRVGPLDGTNLEVAFYASLETALAPRTIRSSSGKMGYDPGCLWGYYRPAVKAGE